MFTPAQPAISNHQNLETTVHRPLELHTLLGCTRLRGRSATQRSGKGSEKVLGRVLGKGFSEGF